jgi:hypothetical protein
MGDQLADQFASQAFSRARHKAFLNRVWAALRGNSRQLLPFDAVREKLHLGGPIYRGVHPVPVAQIVGSVGRYHDFDSAFLPTHDKMQERWKSIGRAFYQDISLPPVTLYKVGDAYFVLDGNHRVSVAREEGQAYVDAEVMEVQVRVPVGPDLQMEHLEVLGERVDFLERARLDRLRPEADVRFTVGGGYERLLEHIAVHRYYMGLEAQHDISEDEAVAHWYDHVYLPLVQVVREHDVLKEFPGRTEADLYLWIMDHRHYLREACADEEVSTERAADDYAEHHRERPATPVERVVHAAKQVVQSLLGPATGQGAEGIGDAGPAEGPSDSESQ